MPQYFRNLYKVNGKCAPLRRNEGSVRMPISRVCSAKPKRDTIITL